MWRDVMWQIIIVGPASSNQLKSEKIYTLSNEFETDSAHMSFNTSSSILLEEQEKKKTVLIEGGL